VAGRVSVVVLNWNSGPLGADAARSAADLDHPDVEVVVVDNDSHDDSLDRIIDTVPDAVVVRNSENLGFGGGMNAGFAVATGEFIVALNCDATLEPGYVTPLIETLRLDRHAAVAGGLVHSSRVGASGPLAITRTMRTSSLAIDEPRRCDKVNGACPLCRAAAIDEVVERFGGPYDAGYFTYGEDVDLALTLRALGWTYRYDPRAVAHHLRSFGSAPRLADRRGRLRTTTMANRHRNIVRHAPAPWLPVSLFALAQDLGFVAMQLARRDISVLRDVTTAWRQVARSLRGDLRRRRTLRELAE